MKKTQFRPNVFPPLWKRIILFFAKRAALGIILLLRLFPVEETSRIKENIKPIGKLDYASGNIYMQVDSRMELARLRACAKEPETVRWIEKNLYAGEVLYDVGANVGGYTFVAHAATKGRCRVYAFEPSFSTFAALCQNIYINGCASNVTAYQIALASETKSTIFKYISMAPGEALHELGKSLSDGMDISAERIGGFQELKHLGRDVYMDQNGKVLIRPAFFAPVLCYRLDDFVRTFELPAPNHIKLDVDGLEVEVLMGAEETLEYPGLRSILVEAGENAQALKIDALLSKCGFQFDAEQSQRPGYSHGKYFNMVYVRKT